MSKLTSSNRSFTSEEYALAKWMLENGEEIAASFIPQLELAEISPQRCPCGCASFDIIIKGHSVDRGKGITIIGDFGFDNKEDKYGAFIFECEGYLAGVEVYGVTGDAPKTLPKPESLKKF